MRLSVCIPTIPGRESTLSRALWHLQRQSGPFEVLVAQGDGGMGDKVNTMFAEARGKFVVVLDDDDYLPLNYMSRVLPNLDRVDALGYRILALRNGRWWLDISHNPTNPFGGNTLDRGVCHKIPVRTDIAREVPFGNEYTADWPWSEAVHNLVESSAYLDEHLYVYDWWPEAMAFKDGIPSDVGEWPYDPEKIRWL